MGSVGECKLCGEKIVYKPDAISALGAHLLEKHPENNVVQYKLLYEDVGGPEICTCVCDCNCICKNLEIDAGKKVKFNAKNRNLKTSIEKWNFGPQAVDCPKCMRSGVPYVKRQRHRLTGSALSSFLLLACWPLCFLSFLLGGSDMFYIYCKYCGCLIGIFDRKILQQKKPLCKLTTPSGEPQICECEKTEKEHKKKSKSNSNT